MLVRRYASILVEMEKNAHAQSNADSLALTIFMSGQAGGELCLFKKVSQSASKFSQEKIDKCAGSWNFCFYSIFALECYFVLLLQLWPVFH